MQQGTLKIDDEFREIGTKTVDDRNRLTLGELPASELWLYQNKEACQGVQKGLDDAARGKISKLDLN
jgi:hypothetical protein